jgi:hypothetical protein
MVIGVASEKDQRRQRPQKHHTDDKPSNEEPETARPAA